MSRFRSGKEISAAIRGLADGTVDIVVSTHKLLSQDVKFAQLGLLIIDEEHRSGVRPGAMKAMRAGDRCADHADSAHMGMALEACAT
jgi:transcription-repair coupling factor (superfamily II helicase)